MRTRHILTPLSLITVNQMITNTFSTHNKILYSIEEVYSERITKNSLVGAIAYAVPKQSCSKLLLSVYILHNKRILCINPS